MKKYKETQADKEFEAMILRQQAEVHCRCLRTALAKPPLRWWLAGRRPKLWRAGADDSPPYFEAATLFIERNLCDPLRSEILWLRKQVDWMA